MAAKNEDSSIGNDSSEGKSLKVLILGDTDIGKTSLIKTYVDCDRFRPKELGIFKVYHGRMKHVEYKKVEFFDLNPGTNCPVRRAGYPKDVNAILLCFSIGKYDTLNNVNIGWIYEVRVHFGKNVPVLLAGLKSDARIVAAPPSENDRLVEKSEADAIHKRHRFHGEYMECTINDRDSILNALNKAVLAAIGD